MKDNKLKEFNSKVLYNNMLPVKKKITEVEMVMTYVIYKNVA